MTRSDLSLPELSQFIVKAKAATYVGSGEKSLSYRPGSFDLQFHSAPFSYLDSYFGGTDFIGQEVVYFVHEPVWVMNYYGYILRNDLISAAQARQVIKVILTRLYEEGRFLGDFTFAHSDFVYTDTNQDDFTHFTGKEIITHDAITVYELVYHGGLVKP